MEILSQKGDETLKNDHIKNLKPHAHLHIIERKPAKFHKNLTKGVGRVLDTKFGTDAHTQMDEGHFYNLSPMLGNNKMYYRTFLVLFLNLCCEFHGVDILQGVPAQEKCG